MKRASANLLLALFSLSLIPAASFSDADAKVPACCRKDGKHKCGMMGSAAREEAPSDVFIKSLKLKCPLFPAGAVASVSGKTGIPTAARVLIACVAYYANAPEQAEAQYRVSFDRAWPKRGPPSLLS